MYIRNNREATQQLYKFEKKILSMFKFVSIRPGRLIICNNFNYNFAIESR